MIFFGEYDDYGETHKYLTIDLSEEGKYPTRVLSIFQTTNPLTDSFEYDINAKWTSDQCHPTMCLSEHEIIELSNKLNILVEQIQSRNKP